MMMTGNWIVNSIIIKNNSRDTEMTRKRRRVTRRETYVETYRVIEKDRQRLTENHMQRNSHRAKHEKE